MRASCSTGAMDTCGERVTAGGFADRAFRGEELDDRVGFSRSGASRARTVPFEQMGHSAVKRLWRQKRELMRPSEDTLPPVLTAVLSDLHLGTRSQADVLRR